MLNTLKSILHDHFGIRADTLKKLAGYDNANYLVKAGASKYIIKTYAWDSEINDMLRAESEILLQLFADNPSCYPVPLAASSGETVLITNLDERKSIVRVLSFLEGKFLAESNHTPMLFKSLGTFLAKMDHALVRISNPTIKGRVYAWDIQHAYLNRAHLQDIADPSKRKLVEYYLLKFDQVVRPVLPDLRKTIIHSDANDWNILVNNGRVSAIIDFGDIVYSPVINELAIAITYTIMGKNDPVSWACHIIKAYNKIYPLQKPEIDLLYWLTAARLCISVCKSAHSKIIDPENAYPSVSEQAAWDLLHLWIAINPQFASRKFKEACGMSNAKEESIAKKIEKRHRHIDPIVSLSYREPICMLQAAFQYMYDGYGNTFLDAYNNIPHVGHSHPKVVEAGQRQMALLNTNTRYVYDLLGNYAERLLAKFPAPLNKIFFVNSGSAASDLALRIAAHYTNSRHIMVVEHGYHGHTMSGIDASDYKFGNSKGPGQQPHVLKVPLPDVFKSRFASDQAGVQYASEALRLLEDREHKVGALITEPIVGCGGQVPLAPGYLQHLYPAIRAQGGLCISDEVQTGFGRTGAHFWGFEAHEVIPDIVVLGKPMGNGHPMGAVVTTDEIAASFGEGVEFFSSFGGNPVSCAIGLAVLDVLEEESLQRNALEVGTYYQQLMKELQQDLPAVADVRGSGLFLGFEIVDGEGSENTRLAAHIKNELRDRHILISRDGPFDNVLKSKPPLCFTKGNALQVVEQIADILKKESNW